MPGKYAASTCKLLQIDCTWTLIDSKKRWLANKMKLAYLLIQILEEV